MFPSVVLASLLASGGSAQLLNIPGLLASLGPARADDPRFTTWTPPGPNDVRSPCPGLNTLANHGFLHHDGRNMNLVHLLKGMAAGLNMGPDFSIGVGAAGLLASKTPLTSFNLDDLDQHNFPIEHDASLSRQDDFFSNDHDFFDPFWQDVLSFYSTYGGQTAYLPAALAISNRTQTSNETNPEFVYGIREFLFRYGESALYLQAMGANDLDGVTRLDWVRSLFEEERLPYNLGWRPRALPITFASIGLGVMQLYGKNPEAAPESKMIFQDSYKDLFIALVGGSQVLNNITEGLSSAVGL